ncbi:UDP-N-acetylmuramoyl-L-alanyl-D-glutamate--2,6-diaminopimelate ligase [Deferribacter thermophilus]|uniref:UDP-N-acetylmuramoyl-L-alanyl-D-glutamate--2, 6-diaminopimelate ligase n=1 Tax=Deferribacter thermophilus TaxID=53573 RepID=UPI003C2A7F4D
MKVKDLLKGLDYFCKDKNLLEIEINDISFDTRDIKEDSIFVCNKGVNYDTHNDIERLKNDSRIKVIITEKSYDFQTVVVKDGRKALALICKNLFLNGYTPKLIGITGTNGKTTTCYLIDHILSFANIKTARLGTINYKIDDEIYPAPTTTPSPYDLYKMISKAKNKGCSNVVMEVSSHALDQSRVFGLTYDYAVYTNLSGDHLDYHESIDDYFKAKSRLFHEYLNGYAIINIDDSYGEKLRESLENKNNCLTYSFNSNNANIFVKSYDKGLEKSFVLFELDGRELEVETKLVGKHNIYNLMASILVAYKYGIDLEQIKKAIVSFENVPGRLDKIVHNNIYVFIDYAHTDDALKNVLQSLLPFKKRRIITLFGCGGDRDKTKRPRMAKVAEEYSDLVVVTSDNPRNEDPQSIINDILKGFDDNSKVIVEVDRRRAIEIALGNALEGDIVLIAGKGHEDYQLIKGIKYHFDDKEEVLRFFGKI